MNKLTFIIVAFLFFSSCNRENDPMEQLTWAGDWQATSVVRDGKLTEIPISPTGPNPEYIRITIDEGDNGFLGGNTFNNLFGIEFWLFPNKKVEFGTITGTRAQEEVWGGAVLRNILMTDSYEVTKENLHFKDTDSNTLVTFTKPQ